MPAVNSQTEGIWLGSKYICVYVFVVYIYISYILIQILQVHRRLGKFQRKSFGQERKDRSSAA